MSDKYYRVREDNFMWKKGAILKYRKDTGRLGGYTAIEDVWDSCELKGEYISARIIEAVENSKYFERIYEYAFSGKEFQTKEEMIKFFDRNF